MYLGNRKFVLRLSVVCSISSVFFLAPPPPRCCHVSAFRLILCTYNLWLWGLAINYAFRGFIFTGNGWVTFIHHTHNLYAVYSSSSEIMSWIWTVFRIMPTPITNGLIGVCFMLKLNIVVTWHCALINLIVWILN